MGRGSTLGVRGNRSAGTLSDAGITELVLVEDAVGSSLFLLTTQLVDFSTQGGQLAAVPLLLFSQIALMLAGVDVVAAAYCVSHAGFGLQLGLEIVDGPLLAELGLLELAATSAEHRGSSMGDAPV